ncbi:bifunctional nuclease domain-containing protein [Corynebacterium senegalense]|uniref:bifunctional nuclease domain-containing protein n=1 Tax=Corynebacterium senegalense TaxID=2080750 RepID=UPI000E1FE829|nr:bifunctional nuclease domain-containing protein [Corynebacterium senegalense]
MVPVTLTGVYTLGPENFVCALLHAEDPARYIPVWLPPVEGAHLVARAAGWSPNRPTAHDLLAEVVGEGLQSIELSSYYNGVFMATLTLGDGTELDTRASDALAVALILDRDIEADETVVAQAGMRLTADAAKTYFDLDVVEEETGASASGDEEKDAAFEQFMRDLGVDEDELDGGDEGEV